MRALCLAVAVATFVGFSGCGSDKNAVMPDVTGKKLDVAKSAIKDAGFEDEVKVDGGGVFGVIKESNWEVCDQSPAGRRGRVGCTATDSRPFLRRRRGAERDVGAERDAPNSRNPTQLSQATPTPTRS